MFLSPSFFSLSYFLILLATCLCLSSFFCIFCCWCSFPLVKRVKSSLPPVLPSGWSSHSTLNFDHLPFHLLTKPERRFLSSLTPNPFGSPQPLFSGKDFLFLLRSHFADLLDRFCNDSLRIHLTTGECYVDRMFHSGVAGSLRVFRLGLVRAYPMPLKGARFVYWFGYPREHYPLVPRNFRARFPPHDAFAELCFRTLRVGLEGSLFHASASLWRLPHWDGSGDFVVDNCLRVEHTGQSSYWWFEVHTGSKGFDASDFLKRLLTAEKELAGRGRYVVLVPFKRDRDKALQAIHVYNLRSKVDPSLPLLDLRLSQVIHFTALSNLREQMGFYHHRTT